MSTTPDLSAVAAWLARRGWATYPQAPETNVPRRNCSQCREIGEQGRQCPGPHGRCPCLVSVEAPCHALHAASTDVELTSSRWEHAPRCNPAVHLGRSGLVVLDIDNHGSAAPADLAPGLPNHGAVNGVQSFVMLLDHLGVDWPDTLTVESPTGVHLYFQAPRTPLRTTLAAWQVEVKAGATSITAPGSLRRVDGELVPYRRVSDTAEPAAFPAWLGRWLVHIGRVPDPTKPASPPPVPTPRTGGEAGEHSPSWWSRAWHDQLAEIESAAPGERFHTLGRRAGRLFALTAQPGCPWTAEDAERALMEAQVQRAARLGIHAPESEYRSQVRSMREYATRHYALAGVAR